MAAAVRAALYLRVSTGRQADNDLSIPDQRRQAKAYCASRGWEIAADYVEPGAGLGKPADVKLKLELVAEEAAEAVHHDHIERRRLGGRGVDHALELRP